MPTLAVSLPSGVSDSYGGQNPSYWPAVEVSYDALNKGDANRFAREAPDQVVADDLPTRRSLLSRLRNVEDNDSWRTFFDTYWRLLYNVARKSGLADHHAQDVVQETVIAVARKIPDFRYDPVKGSFKQWLLLICRRRIHDHFRRAYSGSGELQHDSHEEAGTADKMAAPAGGPDMQLDEIWEQEWRENIFDRALLAVRQRVNPKQYQVFDCCVLQNQRPAEVARMLGMNAAQVYLAKHRVSAAVKQAVKEIEAELGCGQHPN